jgi:serine phosphatase RsbU (regulator of sigma subunit)
MLGDVSGKGVVASVLMTVTQGHLHAAMRHTADPAQAVAETHRFVVTRRPMGKFVTAWVCVIDPAARTLTYCDAGHGFALLVGKDGSCRQLSEGGGAPVGLVDDDDVRYENSRVSLDDSAGLVIVSDGIIEEFGVIPGEGTLRSEQFGVERLSRYACRLAADANPVPAVFEAVYAHCQSRKLNDDATVVWVRF